MTQNILIKISDITTSTSDCIVNAANQTLLGGGGVDGAIHRAAGSKLLEECKTLNGCKTGEAKITKGYNLKAKYVIHTVGPIYMQSAKPRHYLASCYKNCLDLAKIHNLHSIDFPAISCGVYGYPITEACEIAYDTIYSWLNENADYPMQVTLSCFNQEIYDTYTNIAKDYK